MRTVEQALLAEEQVCARQAMNSHHLLVGHSTNLPPKLIVAITQLNIEDSQRVRIEHRSGLTSTAVRGVIDGVLHAGFGILPLRVPELLIRPIYEEPLVVCMPTGHRLATKLAVSPQDFDGEPFIAVSREPWPERHREVEEHFGDFGVVLTIGRCVFGKRGACVCGTESRRLPAAWLVGCRQTGNRLKAAFNSCADEAVRHIHP